MSRSQTLVAGIGNIFLGDDGFGVEVVRRLAERPARQGVCVVDFGIRGLDLTYALLDAERVILVDAMPRGRTPGTLYVLDPDLTPFGGSEPNALGAHAVVPEHALSIAQAMGRRFGFVRVVGCEPADVPAGDDLSVGLSPAVAGAVDRAVNLVEMLLEAADA